MIKLVKLYIWSLIKKYVQNVKRNSKQRKNIRNFVQINVQQYLIIPRSIRSEESKQRISKGALKSYQDGQRVGGGFTKWHDYKNIRVQGTFELRTCQILDIWKESNVIKDWEYTNDRIEYIGRR